MNSNRSHRPVAIKKGQYQNIEEMLHLIENFTDLETFTESYIIRNSDQILKNIVKHIHILESVNILDEGESSIRFWDAFSKHCQIISVLIRAISEMKSRLEKSYENYVQRHSELNMQEENEGGRNETTDFETHEIIDALGAENDNSNVIEDTSYLVKQDVPLHKESLSLRCVQNMYICVECGVLFKNRGSLKPHYDQVHRKVKSKTCPVCNRQFARSGDLTRHVRSHVGERPFKCPQCSQTFISSGDMNKHVRRHNRDRVPIPRNFVCNICGAAFNLSNSLKRHAKKHERVELREFVCEFCSKKFYRKDQLKQHIIRHLGLLSFACSICGKEFCDKKNRLKHELKHQMGLTCDYCRKLLKTKSELIKHFKKIHNIDM